jgi:hypothetical protein
MSSKQTSAIDVQFQSLSAIDGNWLVVGWIIVCLFACSIRQSAWNQRNLYEQWKHITSWINRIRRVCVSLGTKSRYDRLVDRLKGAWLNVYEWWNHVCRITDIHSHPISLLMARTVGVRWNVWVVDCRWFVYVTYFNLQVIAVLLTTLEWDYSESR